MTLHTNMGTKQEVSCTICTVHWFVMGNGDGGNRNVVTCGRRRWWQQDCRNVWKKQEINIYVFIGNSMQKDNRGDREADVRIILKCMSEKGQVL